MKTKIIYISGSEVFEMADVRAAFDEVRATLGLGRDTVLFGVPVDNDDALAQTHESAATPVTTRPESQDAVTTDEVAINIESETDVIAAPTMADPEPEIAAPAAIAPEVDEKVIIPEIQEQETVPAEEAPAPVKKSRGRPRKVAQPVAAETSEPVVQSAPEKVIPILSVLSANSAATEIVEAAPAPAEEIEESATHDAPTDAAEDITDTVAQEPEIIDDLINDQVPEEPVEKTLEQLLESMTPLREDHGTATAVDAADDVVDMDQEYDTPVADTDATLEQLAAEFADTQDKIAAPAPAPTHGKIGKLKNILPFKKARRDDTGLMGDLFGWAGVAANDEDFTIPGFFTTAAKK